MRPLAPAVAPWCSNPCGHALRPWLVLAALVLVTAAAPLRAAPLFPLAPCYTGWDAGGNGQYPPSCPRGFTSHDGIMIIENGLPAGSAIIGRMSFFDISIVTETPGGPLGGEVTTVNARIQLEMRGLGAVGGYARTFVMPVTMRFSTGPQVPGTTSQVFLVDLDQAFGQIIGDPDFDLLRITAGSAFGMPGPGRATLTLASSADWLVDSFFDITYRVDFIGQPGGPFGGWSGSTTSMHRQRAGSSTNDVCLVPDNGTGTANWTPFGAGWWAKTEGMLYEGSPGTFLIGHMRRIPPGGLTSVPGGTFGGEQTADTEQLLLEVVGEGQLAGFQRAAAMSLSTWHDLGPAMALVPQQGRVSELMQAFGQVTGDPDFDLLRFVGGTDFSLPSPGHTSLTHVSGGNWAVDSFFDITYRIDMIGAPGSVLAGLSGSTLGESRLQAGRERDGRCLVVDNGTGTADFPPMCATGYAGPRHVRGLLNGMPAGSPVLADLEILPMALTGSGPGGPLGGQWQAWDAKLIVRLTGAGVFWTGYTRTISMLAHLTTATAPVTPGSSPQHYETELTTLQAQVLGDPDFDLLRIAGGTGFGMPSPGHTSLTSAGGIQWRVDSFFDISYRLDFIGAPGGLFAGRSGSTTDRQRFVNGTPTTASTPPRPLPVTISVSPAAPNPTRAGATVALELPRRSRVRVAVHDVAGRLVRIVEDDTREAGVHSLAWDGSGASGSRMAPGLYLLRVDADGVRFSRRVVLTN